MEKPTQQAGIELPVPPDFPVTWDSPEEQALLWRWDNIHSPLPASPMQVSVWEASISEGSRRAAETLRRTGRTLRRRIHGYSYSASVPTTPSPEHRAEEAAAMEEAIRNTRRRWDAEFLPALERDLAYMRSLDLERSPDARLLEYLEEALKLLKEHWYIHTLVVLPLSAAVERLDSLFRHAMGDDAGQGAHQLLQGLDNKSLETDRALQALADEARRRPRVAGVLARGRPCLKTREELAAFAEGREFLGLLDSFLSVYGYRPTGFDLMYPTWVEDPSFVLLNVKGYLASPPRDLEGEAAALAAESSRLLARVLERLEGDRPRREQFLEAYQHARALWPLKEDHSFYIDQGSVAAVRVLIAEMGRRLVRKGVLSVPDDVFFLTLDELIASMAGEAGLDLRGRVKARREERDRSMKVTPPQFLGTLPLEGAAGAPPGPPGMFGPMVLSRPMDGVRALRGVAGSRGVATSVARVVRSPEEFHRVRPGDVLVCVSTSPTWTPLFGSLSALVSDSGGVLSHTAIVAREYGLPAVVGVGYGTSVIADGQLVTVDGDSGVVMLH